MTTAKAVCVSRELRAKRPGPSTKAARLGKGLCSHLTHGPRGWSPEDSVPEVSVCLWGGRGRPWQELWASSAPVSLLMVTIATALERPAGTLVAIVFPHPPAPLPSSLQGARRGWTPGRPGRPRSGSWCCLSLRQRTRGRTAIPPRLRGPEPVPAGGPGPDGALGHVWSAPAKLKGAHGGTAGHLGRMARSHLPARRPEPHPSWAHGRQLQGPREPRGPAIGPSLCCVRSRPAVSGGL